MGKENISVIQTWLEHIEIKIAFKTALAGCFSLVLGMAFSSAFDRPDAVISGLWCVLSSIVVIQVYLGGTYQAAWQRFFGVLVGSIVGLGSYLWLGNGPFSLTIGVFFTVVVCSLLYLKDSLRIACMSTAVIIILAGSKPDVDPLSFSWYRFLDSCLGILVAMLVAYFVWPEKAVENLRENSAKILSILSKYYRISVETNKEKKALENNIEAFYVELSSLLEKNRNYRQDINLELFNKEQQREQWVLLSNHLERIFDSITSLSHIQKDILYTILDASLAYKTVEIVNQSDLAFQNLSTAIMEENKTVSLKGLQDAINALAQELKRFRETRTTRKFNIEDVEVFFVFFYRVRSIGEELLKTAHFIETLN